MAAGERRSYPVAVEELDGSEDVELAGHEELDGQFPGERRHSMLTGPLVDFLQKLPGRLKQTQMWSRIKHRGSETAL